MHNHSLTIIFIFLLSFISNSPDGSCLNEVSIAQSIISQALPALSPRINLSFSPKSCDRTRLVENSPLEMNKFRENSSLQANLSQLEATINAHRSPKAGDVNDVNETQTPKAATRNEAQANSPPVASPNKWPLKPGVLVHVNSNHTLSPKNQARLQAANTSKTEERDDEANLGLLERNRKTDDSQDKTEYSKKTGKPRRHTQNVVTGIFKTLRRKSTDSDDSGKYKKINKTNKRAVSLVNLNKTGYSLPKNRLRSFFQSETPNVIVTEGGRYCVHFITLHTITKHTHFPFSYYNVL